MTDFIDQPITREEYPLVSVVVITYNSAKYVLETLESAKAQTYQNIELIVSDDCSTDNTLEICSKWIDENKSRFVRAEIIETKNNTGVSGNCNRGLIASTGEWLKLIAGDDILLPDCLWLFYSETHVHSDAKIFVSQRYVLCGHLVDQIHKPIAKLLPNNTSKQLLNLLRYGSLSGSAFFFHRNTIIDIGGFDEKYSSVEDYPLLIKLLQSGYYICSVNKPTLIYRVHENSLTNALNSSFSDCMGRYYKEVIVPLAKKKNIKAWLWHYFLNEKYAVSICANKFIIRWVIRSTDYIYWENKIMRIIGYSTYSMEKIEKIQSVHYGSLIKKNDKILV